MDYINFDVIYARKVLSPCKQTEEGGNKFNWEKSFLSVKVQAVFFLIFTLLESIDVSENSKINNWNYYTKWVA